MRVAHGTQKFSKIEDVVVLAQRADHPHMHPGEDTQGETGQGGVLGVGDHGPHTAQMVRKAWRAHFGAA